MDYLLYRLCTGHWIFQGKYNCKVWDVGISLKIYNYNIHEKQQGNIQIKKVKEELTKIWLPMDLLNHYGRTISNQDSVLNQIQLTISKG